MDTDELKGAMRDIDNTLERIANALERPTPLAIYGRHPIEAMKLLTENLKQYGVLPVFIERPKTEDAQPNGAAPELMGLLS